MVMCGRWRGRWWIVKGHATSEDINEARSNEKERAGNDYADELADSGVLIIGGAG